ncbi:polysaccharide biosynthesis protein [Lachnospiraceae bacterium 46-15]
MNQKRVILQGAFVLTIVGFVSRIIGFFYRIFLSHAIGAEGVGIYQLIFPVYTMAFSLTAAGIQTAISKNVSEKMALDDKKGARNTFFAGLILTTCGTLLVSLFLYREAGWISAAFLKETRCEPLIRMLAFALPSAGIHSCVGGYYFGMKKTHVPAISQLVEQAARVSVSYLVYVIFLEKGIRPTPVLAVIGLIFEELASALFSLTAAALHFGKTRISSLTSKPSLPFTGILKISLPLTANRVLINLLQSMEAICIPLRLQLAGLSVSSALSIYGVLTGMALPLVLFPSAITNSISVMLLPTVSEAQAAGSQRQISRTLENTIQYCLILGILCTGIFLCFGESMGRVLFASSLAGKFILILAWICPFLYLGTTLTSILNGMGKAVTTFWQNTVSLLIRILFVWFAIPRFGVAGYLWGILVSQLLSAALALFVLSRHVPFHFDSLGWIVKPLAALGVSVGIMLFFRSCLLYISWKIIPVLEMFLSILILCAVYIGIMFFSQIYILLRRRGIIKA